MEQFSCVKTYSTSFKENQLTVKMLDIKACCEPSIQEVMAGFIY